MLHEMDLKKLDVVLIPAPDPQFIGHKIRVVQNENPEWYRGENLNRKKVRIALNCIRFGLPLYSETDFKVLDLVKTELENVKMMAHEN